MFDSITTTIAFAVVVSAVVAVVVSIVPNRVFNARARCTVPSGPPGHWLWGNSRIPLDQLTKTLFSWRKDFGPVFNFRLFRFKSLFIIINDIKIAKEMLADRDFAGRETRKNAGQLSLNPQMKGIINQSWNPSWKELHRFTLTTLSSMGFGRVQMQDKVLAEADALVEEMLNTRGDAFDPAVMIRIAVSNVISNVVFNIRTEIGQPSPIHDRLKAYLEGFIYLVMHPIYNAFPFLMKLFPTRKLKAAIEAKSFVRNFIRESIKEHRASLNPDEPRDFVDALIAERERLPNAEHLSDENVHQAIQDLFLAGTDTTSSALTWAIAWLLHRPDVREKLVREIEEVLGSDAAPSIVALGRFHYLQAFTDEVLRRSTVLDHTSHHRPIVPVAKLAGYDVPNDEVILVNLWGIHHDPDLWPDPTQFRPERFLDSDGKYQKNENLIPFSFGARRCLGEKLARLELFVFLIRLLQRVRLQIAEGSRLPEMEGRKPGVRVPGHYLVTARAVR